MNLKSHPWHFILAVNSSRTDLQEISYSGWLCSPTVSLRTTRWKAHSDQAGKGTFPQLQGKLATTNSSDHRIDFVFGIHFYGSWSLAGKKNKTWGFNIFYWSHPLRIQGLSPFLNTYAQGLFILPETTEYCPHGQYSAFKQTHTQKRSLFKLDKPCFFFWQTASYQCIWTLLKSLYLLLFMNALPNNFQKENWRSNISFSWHFVTHPLTLSPKEPKV